MILLLCMNCNLGRMWKPEDLKVILTRKNGKVTAWPVCLSITRFREKQHPLVFTPQSYFFFFFLLTRWVEKLGSICCRCCFKEAPGEQTTGAKAQQDQGRMPTCWEVNPADPFSIPTSPILLNRDYLVPPTSSTIFWVRVPFHFPLHSIQGLAIPLLLPPSFIQKFLNSKLTEAGQGMCTHPNSTFKI